MSRIFSSFGLSLDSKSSSESCLSKCWLLRSTESVSSEFDGEAGNSPSTFGDSDSVLLSQFRSSDSSLDGSQSFSKGALEDSRSGFDTVALCLDAALTFFLATGTAAAE